MLNRRPVFRDMGKTFSKNTTFNIIQFCKRQQKNLLFLIPSVTSLLRFLKMDTSLKTPSLKIRHTVQNIEKISVPGHHTIFVTHIVSTPWTKNIYCWQASTGVSNCHNQTPWRGTVDVKSLLLNFMNTHINHQRC